MLKSNKIKSMVKGVVLASCVTALLTGTAFADNKPVIGAALADQRSLFYIAAADGMKDAAAELGYELRLTSANNNSREQINQVNNLLTQQIGALLFISQDSTAAAAGVRAANQGNVPVIAVDQRPESGDGRIETFIATDSVRAARQLCTWIFEQIGGSGDIAILRGVEGSTAQIQRSQGCQEALEEFPDINVVATQTANWDENEAFRATQNILTANPNLAAVVGESDAMALGAARAGRRAGHEGLITGGIDGFPTMLSAIKDGLTQVTMAQIPYQMGRMAVEDAVRILEGRGDEVPELQYQDAVMITADNVDDFSPSDFYGPAADRM